MIEESIFVYESEKHVSIIERVRISE